MRVYLSFGMIVVIAFAVLYKLFHVQTVQGAQWRAMADSLSTRNQTIEAVRGNIYSNDGSLLATSVPEYDVRMDMLAPGIQDDDVFYGKVDSLARALAGFFGDKPTDQYKRLLRQARQNKNRYYLVKRNVSFQELKAVRTFPIFNMGKYKGGLIPEQKNKRIFPFNDLAERTIGYKKATVQPVGLEGAYAEYIDGASGSRMVQRIAGGAWMPVNEEAEISPTDGADIISTIDINMQDVAQKALKDQLIKSDADNGTVILMEVATGEIRVVANYTRISEGVYKEKFNYAIAQSAEPGSTFKLASYMVALEDGKIDTSDIVDTGDGTYRVHRHTIRDSHAGGYGKVTVKQAFAHSSNTAITKIIHQKYKDGPEAFTKGLYAMNLNEKLGLQIPGEGSPLIKTPSSKSWSGLTLAQMSWGYELKMTPLQMLTFYNAVANKGKMVAPLFVKEIRRLGKPVETFKARVINDKIASDHTIGKVHDMLEAVITEGTGKELMSAPFRIAGKTGTAQMAQGSAGYKLNRAYQGSFSGYFPADNPKYSMIVVIQNPRKGGYYAATVALPVFKQVAERVYANDFHIHQSSKSVRLAKVGEKPSVKKGSKHRAGKAVGYLGLTAATGDYQGGSEEEDMAFVEKRVPDVKGMGLKDALYLLGNAGLKAQVIGRGAVIRQSIDAGAVVPTGYSILIELK